MHNSEIAKIIKWLDLLGCRSFANKFIQYIDEKSACSALPATIALFRFFFRFPFCCAQLFSSLGVMMLSIGLLSVLPFADFMRIYCLVLYITWSRCTAISMPGKTTRNILCLRVIHNYFPSYLQICTIDTHALAFYSIHCTPYTMHSHYTFAFPCVLVLQM